MSGGFICVAAMVTGLGWLVSDSESDEFDPPGGVELLCRGDPPGGVKLLCRGVGSGLVSGAVTGGEPWAS